MKLKIKNKLLAVIFSLISLISIIICLIIDFVINHQLSWSLITLFSILFCWLLFIPILIFAKRKRIIGSLISLTIFILPYFLILSFLLHNFNIIKIGGISSFITLLYLWGTYIIYRKLSGHGFKGAGFELLLTAFFSLSINIVISLIISRNTLNILNIICIVIILIFSIICFIYDNKYKE